jgi:hypothetical protein
MRFNKGKREAELFIKKDEYAKSIKELERA